MKAKDANRRDESPPGWEHTTEKMKSHGEIDNPFALAWYMHEQGFTPQDALNKDTLDAACEMYTGAGMHDDLNEYEKETEELVETPEETFMHDDDPDMVFSHGAGHSPAGHHGAEHSHEDDEEKLLDDSEIAAGEHEPSTEAPTSDPSVKSMPVGVSHNISDPMPDDMGLEEFEHHDDMDDDEY